MAGYTKLFQDIIDSTIWREPNDAKVLWITILAKKDRNQICNLPIPTLAAYAGVTIERCEEILERFQQPDKYSRTKTDEGRRIRVVDDGFFVINGEKYRDKMSPDEVREYNRIKKAESRARQNENQPDAVTSPKTHKHPPRVMSPQPPKGKADIESVNRELQSPI